MSKKPAYKKVLIYMRAAVCTAALTLSACGEIGADGDKGYTFRFKVDNYTTKVITKVTFINGNTQNDTIVNYWSSRIEPGPGTGSRSSEYRQSGFTIEQGSAYRLFGVMITFEDGATAFNSDRAGHEAKILITVVSPYYHNPSGITFDTWH